MTATWQPHYVSIEATDFCAQAICSCEWHGTVYDNYFGTESPASMWKKAGAQGETHRTIRQYFEDKKVGPSAYDVGYTL